jgi:hypothetical protein
MTLKEKELYRALYKRCHDRAEFECLVLDIENMAEQKKFFRLAATLSDEFADSEESLKKVRRAV